jgi:hypothetical protein
VPWLGAADHPLDGIPAQPEFPGERADRPAMLVQDFDFHLDSFRLHVSPPLLLMA